MTEPTITVENRSDATTFAAAPYAWLTASTTDPRLNLTTRSLCGDWTPRAELRALRAVLNHAHDAGLLDDGDPEPFSEPWAADTPLVVQFERRVVVEMTSAALEAARTIEVEHPDDHAAQFAAFERWANNYIGVAQ